MEYIFNIIYLNVLLLITYLLVTQISNFIYQRNHLSVNHILNPKQSIQSILKPLTAFIQLENHWIHVLLQILFISGIQSGCLLLILDKSSQIEILLESILVMNSLFLIGTFNQSKYRQQKFLRISDAINIFISLNLLLFFGIIYKGVLMVTNQNMLFIFSSAIYALFLMSGVFLLRIWLRSVDMPWKQWVQFIFTGYWVFLSSYIVIGKEPWWSIEVLAIFSLVFNVVFDYFENIFPKINNRFTENYVLIKFNRLNIILLGFGLMGFWWLA